MCFVVDRIQNPSKLNVSSFLRSETPDPSIGVSDLAILAEALASLKNGGPLLGAIFECVTASMTFHAYLL